LSSQRARFPIETLVDYGGDCEDTSILFATIVIILNYEAIFISPPSHYAVGVWGTNLQGTYWTYNSKNYYYCETTGNNFRIGELPSEFRDLSANLYSIDENEQYVPGQGSSKILDPWLVSGLGLLLVTAVIGTLYVFSKRAKTRKPEELSPKLPPLSPSTTSSS
jgi:hypothetical protein